MNQSNRELWQALLDKYQRTALLLVDAFVGGIGGGFLNAIGLMQIKPEAFNFGEGLTDLIKATVWSGILSAAAYMRQRGAPVAPPSSVERLPAPSGSPLPPVNP